MLIVSLDALFKTMISCLIKKKRRGCQQQKEYANVYGKIGERCHKPDN